MSKVKTVSIRRPSQGANQTKKSEEKKTEWNELPVMKNYHKTRAENKMTAKETSQSNMRSRAGVSSSQNSLNTRVNNRIKAVAIDNISSNGTYIDPKRPKRVQRQVNSREVDIIPNPTKRKKKPKVRELEYVETIKPPSSYNVTVQEELYIQEILRGTTQVPAYRIAYPEHMHWKDSSIKAHASKLFNTERVQLRYTDLLRALRLKETKLTEWTRDSSRQALESLYTSTRTEMDRITSAYENERALDTQAIEKIHKRLQDPKLGQKEKEQATADLYSITRRMLERDKERRISSIHVDGIVKPVTEINKMFGYTEDNLDLNQVVVFVGEDDIKE